MTDNFDNKLDEFKSRIDNLFDSSAVQKSERDGLSILDVQKIVSEQFKLIEGRLLSFQNSLQTLADASDNEKLLLDTARISSDLNTVYAKITSQDVSLQNIIKSISEIDTTVDSDKISKIMNEMANFYRGFDAVTSTINTNFAEFINQFRQYSSKEEFKQLFLDIDAINNNTASIISALSIIDNKYQNLHTIINTLAENESKYLGGLEWLTNISKQLKEMSEQIGTLPQNRSVLDFSNSLNELSTKIDNNFNALNGADDEFKQKFQEAINILDGKLVQILNTNYYEGIEQKFAQMNNFISNTITEFVDVVVGKINLEGKVEEMTDALSSQIAIVNANLDKKSTSEEVSALTQKISTIAEIFENNMNSKFQELDKFEGLKSDLVLNLQEVATLIVQRLSDDKNHNEIKELLLEKHSDISARIAGIVTIEQIKKETVAIINELKTDIYAKILTLDDTDLIKQQMSFLLTTLNRAIEEKFDFINNSLNQSFDLKFTNFEGVLSDKIDTKLSSLSVDLVKNIETNVSVMNMDLTQNLDSRIVALSENFTDSLQTSSLTTTGNITNRINDLSTQIMANVAENVQASANQISEKFEEKSSSNAQNIIGDLSDKLQTSVNYLNDTISDKVISSFTENANANKADLLVSIGNMEQSVSNLQNNIYGLDESIKNSFNQNSQELGAVFAKLQTELAGIQNIISSLDDSEFRQKLDEDYKQLSVTIAAMQPYLEAIYNFDEKMGRTETTLTKLTDEGFVRLQNELRNKTDELEYNFTQVLNTNVSSVSNVVKDDIAGLVEKVEIFTSTLSGVNSETISSIKELVDAAILNIENLRIGSKIQEVTFAMEENFATVKAAFDKVNEHLANIDENSNVDTIKRINNAIPALSDKIDVLRSVLSNENTQNTQSLKKVLEEFVTKHEDYFADIKTDFEKANDKVLDEFNTHILDLKESVTNLITITKEDFTNLNTTSLDAIQTQVGEIKDSINRLIDQTRDEVAYKAVEMIEHNGKVISDLTCEIVESKNAVEEFKNNVSQIPEQVAHIMSNSQSEILSDFNRVMFEIGEKGKNLDADLTNKIAEINNTIEGINNSVADITEAKLNTLASKIEDKQLYVVERLNSLSSSIEEKIGTVAAENSSQFDSKLDKITAKSFDTNEKLANLNELSNSSHDKLNDIVNASRDIYDRLDNVAENSADVVAKIDNLNEKTQDTADKIENLSNAATEISAKVENVSEKSSETIEKLDNLSEKSSEMSTKLERLNTNVSDIKTYLLNEISKIIASNSDKISTDELEDILKTNNEGSQEVTMLANNLLDKLTELQNLNSDMASDDRRNYLELTEQIKSISDALSSSYSQDMNDKIDDISAKLNDVLIFANDLTSMSNSSEIVSNLDDVKRNIVQKIQDEISSIDISDLKSEIAELQNSILSLSNSLSDKEPEQVLNEEIFGKIENTISKSQNNSIENFEEIVSKVENSIEAANVISKANSESVSQKIEKFSGEVEALKKSLEEKLEAQINSLKNSVADSLSNVPKPEIDNEVFEDFISGFEFLQSNFMNDIKAEFESNKNALEDVSKEISKSVNSATLADIVRAAVAEKFEEAKIEDEQKALILTDIKSDFARIKNLLDNSYKQRYPERLEEIRNIGLENIKQFKKSEDNFTFINNWLDNAQRSLDALTARIEKTEKNNLQDIKNRLISSESNTQVADAVEDFRHEFNKKYQVQEIKVDNIDEKLSNFIQKQPAPPDLKPIMEAIKQNATQTQALDARVEGIENQIANIQIGIEKLLDYLDE